MSYILDALKKSDQERQKSTGPTLQTIHRPSVVQERNGSAFWLLLLLCCGLSLILGFITWRYFAFEVSSAGSDLEKTKLVVESSGTSVSNVLEGGGVTDSQKNSNEIERGESSSAPTVQSNYDSVSVSNQPLPVVEFADLPDPVQKEIPALTFSFHVYSENPDRRTIIINNRRVKTGDTVVQGLTLEEITDQGVVLSWKRHFFRINVVEQW